MKNLGCFKDFKVRPLDGAFDARTPSGELNFYDFRVVLNMDLTDQRKRCRMGGWQKLLSDSPFGFKNQDLHDQLLECQTYYEAFSESITYGPVLTGYSYPFWYPGTSFAEEVEITEGETYDGYAPDYYGVYPQYQALGNFICESYIGYPYGEGDSYFQLCYGSITPAYTTDGYGGGEPVPTYLGPYTYDYNYCGDYAFNREHICREAITLLYEAVSVGGRRKLMAGTKSRLYVLNERAGNWRILLDGQNGGYAEDNCGCAQRRFKVAQVGNIVIITNNFDPVMTWEIDAGPSGCDLWSTEFVADLQGLGIQKAGVVAAWQGFAFLADVQVNNEHHGSRIYWSDLNDPRAWAPGGGSAAGFVDLGLGERVTNIEPIGGQLRVYTTRGDEKGIYTVSIVGGTEILSFNEIYRGPDGVEYENSLVNTGGTHAWFSSSGIMVLGEYDRTPQRIEWIYKADAVFYNGLPGEWLRDFDGLDGFGPVNKEQCHNVVGGYNSERKQIWFSWPTDDNTCANMSLALNPVYRAATLVDHGFTAFLTYRPDYTVALREFLAEWAGCDPSTMVMPKEGEPLPVEQGYMPAYIRNETEDPELPPDENSLCGYLGGLTLEDLCDACGVESVFVMASALDKTLKEFTPHQCFRERFVGPYESYIAPEPEPEPEPEPVPECALVITEQPTSQDISTEEDLILAVTVTGNVGALTYQWYKDGVALENGVEAFGTVSGATTATLTITGLTEGASGDYHVVIGDAGAEGCSITSDIATIGVTECDLAITTQPASQAVLDGENLVLFFAYTSSSGGPFTIQWFLDDVPLADGASGSSTISGSDTVTLTITDWTPALEGSYHATIVDDGESACEAQTDAAIITEELVCDLAIDAQPVNTGYFENDTVELTVTTTGGVGPLTYQWYRNGVALVDGPQMDSNVSGATTATLTITNTDPQMAGSYHVEIIDTGVPDCAAESNAVNVYMLFFSEDFEGALPPSNAPSPTCFESASWAVETSVGGSLTANTTSPICGTCSLRLLGGTLGQETDAKHSVPAGQTEAWIHVRVRVDNIPTNDTPIIRLGASADSNPASGELRVVMRTAANGQTIQITSPGAVSVDTVEPYSSGVEYHFWVYYNATTGEGWVKFHTTGVEPPVGDFMASYTGGSNASIDYIWLQSMDTLLYDFDTVRWANFTIGDIEC